MRTELCERFGIEYPIFVFTPSEKVAAAVSKAGGLGALGCARLFPRVVGEGLAFAQVDEWDELRPGALGVPEPPPARAAVTLGPEDVAIVPGVAFDRSGRRLGRGGGHYDRAFAAAGAWRIGVAFQLQLVPAVPHDSRDRPMDAIVTEQGLQVRAGASR